MKSHGVVCSILLLTVVAPSIDAQTERRDKGIFVVPRNEFLDSINAESGRFRKPAAEPQKAFQLDFSTISAPSAVGEFTSAWHSGPISQGGTGTCWAFSTTSFFESEIYRLSKREIKLSEAYSVYWECVEKAKEYVRTRGTSAFGQGSEASALPRLWRAYGIVPAAAYSGLKPGQKFHDHGAMFTEMQNYLRAVKSQDAWDEETVVRTIRSIMDHAMGPPPVRLTVEGKEFTPKEYLEKVVRLGLDDYVSILSIMQQPYYQRVEYEVPDNWGRSKEYYNVPLDAYMAVLKNALARGYTGVFSGDVSEAGYEGHAGVGVIPSFDIPSQYIDEHARQFRFSNSTTRDDHLIHVVGYLQKDGKDWYLLKDSGSGSRNSSHPGYYFYHEDYVKLKMLALTVHKDVAKEVLAKFAE